MITPLNRITDIGVGPCEITVQITGSPNTITEYIPQSRLLDLHVWFCPCPFPPKHGIGINLPGSMTVYDNWLNIHRILDLQIGCTISIVVTGAWRTWSGT